MPTTGRPTAIWDLRSEHSGAFLRLQRTLKGRESFTLCFLTYSDSFYRDKVAGFLEERLRARVRVSIDSDTRIGTECLFEKLGADRQSGPAQLVGLERWPEGFDNLLTRLNYRREALAERCARPLLVWVRSAGSSQRRDTRGGSLGMALGSIRFHAAGRYGSPRPAPYPCRPYDRAGASPFGAYRGVEAVSCGAILVASDRCGPVDRAGGSATLSRRNRAGGSRLYARERRPLQHGRSQADRRRRGPNRRHPSGPR